MSRRAQEIAECFAKHLGGEFVLLADGHLSAPYGSGGNTGIVLYTSKPQCVRHVLGSLQPQASIEVVGEYGLPSEDEIHRLARSIGNRKVQFLSDCDPVDLLLFAWLREFVEIAYLGVGDALLARLDMALNDGITIPLAPCEMKAHGVLDRLCPDYRELVGEQCAALINSGRKIELEAAVSFSQHRLGDILNSLSPGPPKA